MALFGVKTFVRHAAVGPPIKRDRRFRQGVTLVEEVVTVFEAKNAASAIKKARKDMEKYCRRETMNIYGQNVVSELLPHIEAFKMFGPLENGASVFGSSEIVRSSESSGRIARRKAGTPPSASVMPLFLPADIGDRLRKRRGAG